MIQSVYSPIFFKSIVNVKIHSKTRLYHPKTFRFGTLYRKISLDQVCGYISNYQMSEKFQV
jgi:hypothetical protein